MRHQFVMPFVMPMNTSSRSISSSLSIFRRKPILQQQFGDEAAVMHLIVERDAQAVFLLARLDLEDIEMRFEQLAGRGVVAVADRHEINRVLPHLPDGRLHVAVEQQLAALDDADLVADVGQLRQDVAGNQDRLAHVAQLFEQAAHLDAGRGSRPLAGSSSSNTCGSCSSTRARPSRCVMPRDRLVTRASRL